MINSIKKYNSPQIKLVIFKKFKLGHIKQRLIINIKALIMFEKTLISLKNK